MIYANVELHNIEEVQTVPGEAGVLLQRVPETVRRQLNARAQKAMLSPACAEIRFVSDSPPARLIVSSPEAAARAVVFHGVFQQRGILQIGKAPTSIELSRPPRLAELDRSWWQNMPFSPHVFRVMLDGSAVQFHAVEGNGLRPPRAGEVPAIRYLAYGTSITHGAAASAPHLTYAGQAARRLGVDLINLGVAGAAYCEPELADYIAARRDWHLATLALTVNMIGAGFTPDEFYERVAYMIDTVAEADTARPVVCITICPHVRDFNPQFRTAGQKGAPDEFRQKLRDAVHSCPHPNVHLIEGAEILTDLGGLTPDLVHPADNGMIQMGENLARRLQPLVDGIRDKRRLTGR